ncbi:MAG TPA: hypothetical protein PKM63_08055 [Panacibacter sp.]|nr:hypothetical protein [Panacibacter sp.]HNP44219.1 hypothetical protein [Panacibacter sp.]
MKSYQFATALVTTFLVVYTVLIYLQGDLRLLSTMFIVSPFVVVWLVYNVIKNAPYDGPERTEEIPDDELSGWKGY